MCVGGGGRGGDMGMVMGVFEVVWVGGSTGGWVCCWAGGWGWVCGGLEV